MNFWKWFGKSMYLLPVLSASRIRPMTQTIFHVLFTLFVACIPFFISLGFILHKQTDQVVTFLETAEVNMTIENQQLTIDKEQTYFFDDHAFLLTNDEQRVDEFVRDHPQGVAFGPTSLLTFTRGSNQAIPYSWIGGTSLSSEDLYDVLTSVASFLPVIVVIYSMIIYMLYASSVFIFITFLATVVCLFKGKASSHITYRHVWGISAHAITAPLLLFLSVDVLVKVYRPLAFLSTFASSALIGTSFLLTMLALKKIPPQRRKLPTK